MFPKCMWAPAMIFSGSCLMQEQFVWVLWEIMSHLSDFMCLNTYKDCPLTGSVRKFHPGNYLIMKLPRNKLCWSSNSTSLEGHDFQFNRLDPLSYVCYLSTECFFSSVRELALAATWQKMCCGSWLVMWLFQVVACLLPQILAPPVCCVAAWQRSPIA